MPKLTDRELVDRARDGDADAFGQLVRRHQQRIHRLAIHMLRDRAEAEDVMQETFVRAYRALDRFDGRSEPYTWLYRIAMNLCIDRARSHKRAQKVEFDEAVDREGEEAGDSGISPHRLGFDPAQAVRDREIRERVSAAMARLSPNHRAVLTLREIDGLAYKEIAEVMQCSEGTVMSRLFHARKYMQEMLRSLVEEEAPATARAPAGAGSGRR